MYTAGIIQRVVNRVFAVQDILPLFIGGRDKYADQIGDDHGLAGTNKAASVSIILM
jgi:hypothetical protein